jgi:hypothetical protein
LLNDDVATPSIGPTTKENASHPFRNETLARLRALELRKKLRLPRMTSDLITMWNVESPCGARKIRMLPKQRSHYVSNCHVKVANNNQHVSPFTSEFERATMSLKIKCFYSSIFNTCSIGRRRHWSVNAKKNF